MKDQFTKRQSQLEISFRFWNMLLRPGLANRNRMHKSCFKLSLRDWQKSIAPAVRHVKELEKAMFSVRPRPWQCEYCQQRAQPQTKGQIPTATFLFLMIPIYWWSPSRKPKMGFLWKDRRKRKQSASFVTSSQKQIRPLLSCLILWCPTKISRR